MPGDEAIILRNRLPPVTSTILGVMAATIHSQMARTAILSPAPCTNLTYTPIPEKIHLGRAGTFPPTNARFYVRTLSTAPTPQCLPDKFAENIFTENIPLPPPSRFFLNGKIQRKISQSSHVNMTQTCLRTNPMAERSARRPREY